jgi:hypothetical protein
MKNKLFMLLAVVAMFASSCKKEVSGCLDVDAINYCSGCTATDGNCEFEGTALFWYDQAASEFLLSDDAFGLTFFVDNKIVGSTSTSVFWTQSPACGSAGSVSFTLPLGKDKKKSFSYRVVDQTNFEYHNGTIEVSATECRRYKLQ